MLDAQLGVESGGLAIEIDQDSLPFAVRQLKSNPTSISLGGPVYLAIIGPRLAPDPRCRVGGLASSRVPLSSERRL